MRVVIATAIVLGLGGAARAQSVKAAEEAFEKGRALMEAKSYADACAAFELSQRLDQQYGTQYNLAGCYAAQDKIANRDESRELCSADACPDRPGSVAAVERARLWGNLSTATASQPKTAARAPSAAPPRKPPPKLPPKPGNDGLGKSRI